jgi:hypothetical protein
VDEGLLARLEAAEGKTIIKAAGNLGYPVGLWLERLSQGDHDPRARGGGCPSRRPRASARTVDHDWRGRGERGLPVIVTVPRSSAARGSG